MKDVNCSESPQTIKIIKNRGPITGLIAGVLGTLKVIFPSPIKEWINLIEKDVLDEEFSGSLSLYEKLEAYLLGFTSSEYCWYGIDQGVNPDLYISEFLRIAYTECINEDPDILNNKKRFHEYMDTKGFSEYLPKIIGSIDSGLVNGEDEIIDILNKEKKIVLKPYYGGGGHGVYICTKNDQRIEINGNLVDNFDFHFNNYIITKYIDQASFLDKIYPHSANTVRLLVINPQGKKPFICRSVLRIGTNKTGGLDNRNKGGLFSKIDLESGDLYPAAETLPSGKIRWHEKHPETKTKIEGFSIPGWNKFKEKILKIIDQLPKFKCVGWDILLKDNNKFVIIEGNSKPVPIVWQVYEPLLENNRIKKFYKDNGVPV